MTENNQTQQNNILLEGLRIVELGHRIAAPLTGMLLAEQGAEVVRIVNSASPSNEPVLDALLARGKTEVKLDLEKPDDCEILKTLLSHADVVIDNYPKGFLSKIGIDFDQVRKDTSPGLISCSIPPFPPGDPREHLPDYEAIAGMAGYLFEKPIGFPQIVDFPIGSVMAGLFAANAVGAALIVRHKTGRGQHVGTSLFESDLFAQILQVLIKTGVPRGFLPMKMIGTPFMSSWLCKDNRYIYLHITLPLHAERILQMLDSNGYTEQVKELREILSEETMRDPSQVKSIPEARKIREAYEKVFLTKSAQEWEHLLGEELCCIKVRTVDEWLHDSLEAEMTDVCEIDDPVFGRMLAPGAAVTAPKHAPVLKARAIDGKALEEIQSRWTAEPSPHKPKQEPLDKIDIKHPLEGYRVLDMSRVIAGPCAARVLGEFGAEVIAIQNPTSLDWALSFHLVFNPGKKSASLNFTNEEGQKKLWKFIETYRPHAFIQNYRHLEIAKKFTIDPERIHARFPDMVYTHLNAYGNEGGWRDRPGFEQVVQAVTGIQITYGRGGKPKLFPSPVIDIGSGLSGALATMIGLYNRERTGQGLFSATHLTNTAVLLQVNVVAKNYRAEALKTARDKGLSVHYDPELEMVEGILRAYDTFVCVAGPKKDVRHWLKATKLAREVDFSKGHAWTESVKGFWMRTSYYWQKALRDAGVDNTVFLMTSNGIRNLVQDIKKYDQRRPPIVRRRDYPEIPSQLTFLGNPVRMSLTPMEDVAPPPCRGGNTKEIMAMIGEHVPEGEGMIPYPKNKPILVWAASFIRWAYFAWRSGNI